MKDAFRESSSGSPQWESEYILHGSGPWTSIYDDEPYPFDDWDRNAKIDGWVCRADEDCEWIDPHLGCDDNEFKMSSIQVYYLVWYMNAKSIKNILDFIQLM